MANGLPVIQYGGKTQTRAIASSSMQTTPRNGIKFRREPVSGGRYAHPENVYPDGDYAQMLDTLYETACETADANNMSAWAAVQEALKWLAPWKFLPSHVDLIQRLVFDYRKAESERNHESR